MKEVTILNKIKETLGIKVKLEQLKLDNGTVVEADVFEADAEIFIVSDDERIPLPIGDYVLEDGRMINVVEDGIIAEIKEKDSEEIEEKPMEEQEVEAKETAVKKVIESVSKETHFTKEDLEVELQKLRDEFDEKFALKETTETTDLKVKLTEEKVEPLKHSPEAEVETKQLNRFSQNRTMSTEDLVFKTMFNKN